MGTSAGAAIAAPREGLLKVTAGTESFDPVESCLKDGTTFKDLPLRVSFESGETSAFFGTVSPIESPAGERTGCLLVLRDGWTEPRHPEDDLNESAAFKSVFQNFPTPLFVVDKNLVLSCVNGPFEKLTGFSRDEILGRKTCSQVLSTAAAPTVDDLLRQAMEEDRLLPESPHTVTNQHGAKTPVMLCVSSLHDSKGGVMGAFGVVRDISRFLESEKKIEFITENTHEGILLLDEEFRIVFANRKMAEMLEVSKEELLSMEVDSILPPQQQRLIAKLIRKVDEQGITALRFCSTMQPLRESPPKYRAFETCIAVSRIGKGVLTCVYFLDISPRVEIESQLRKTNSFLNNIIRSSVDGIIVADTEGNVLIFNEGAESILGYRADEIIGRPEALRRICPTEVMRENMRRMRSSEHGPPGKLNTTRLTFYDKQGEAVPVNFSAAIIQEGGRELGTVGIFSDLREHMRMRRELEEARNQLIQSEKISSLGRLAAGVAHEINNPLAGILIYADMLLKDVGDHAQWREDLEEIIHQTLRCKQIVTRLLDFSRQSLGEQIPYKLNDVIRRCVALLGQQALFMDIEILQDCQEDLPELVGDPSALQQVFTNLLINAADAMKGRGKIYIKSFLNEAGDSVVIRFADTGPGIPPEAMNQIFEPFFTTKGPGEGTGLGLSVAYGLVQQHGGTIEAHNDPAGGAVFTIALPVQSFHAMEDDGVEP